MSAYDTYGGRQFPRCVCVCVTIMRGQSILGSLFLEGCGGAASKALPLGRQERRTFSPHSFSSVQPKEAWHCNDPSVCLTR